MPSSSFSARSKLGGWTISLLVLDDLPTSQLKTLDPRHQLFPPLGMSSTQEDAGVGRIRLWGRAQPVALTMDLFNEEDGHSSTSSVTASDANHSRFSMSQLILEQRESTVTSSGTLPQDAELLRRARAAHSSTDFTALAAGPEQGGPWRFVEAIDQFSVYQRQEQEAATEGRHAFRQQVLCAGRVDASLDEVARILCPSSDAEHNAVMRGLYAKNFIFGSIERKVRCVRCQRHSAIADQTAVDGEQLAVKTSSFVHTSLFGHNEQWCYLDFFQRKPKRDGFTISQCALRPEEATPSRVKVNHARVHQLHGLSALYLVDQLPGRNGLRVVFQSWFDPIPPSSGSGRRGGRRRSFSDSTLNASTTPNSCSETKAQVRRLLALARGVTRLPECVRYRRFSVQVPADLNAPQIDNPRCPCCTCRLSTVRLTLARGLSDRKRLKKKRCYLCGYLVCGWCWSTAQMETETGRVASIVACTRCQTCNEVNRPGSDEQNAS